MRNAAELLAGSAAVIQINTEDNPNLARRFGVSSIPVLHLLQKGTSVGQVAGAQPAESIVTWFRRNVKG